MDYKTAYNKIIDAYFKDEIKPLDCEFCFCGTISPDMNWKYGYRKGRYPYTLEEYEKMEQALLQKTVSLETYYTKEGFAEYYPTLEYENALFNGMCAALEVLKQIHKDRGENVDEEIPFTKRQLACSLQN